MQLSAPAVARSRRFAGGDVVRSREFTLMLDHRVSQPTWFFRVPQDFRCFPEHCLLSVD